MEFLGFLVVESWVPRGVVHGGVETRALGLDFVGNGVG